MERHSRSPLKGAHQKGGGTSLLTPHLFAENETTHTHLTTPTIYEHDAMHFLGAISTTVALAAGVAQAGLSSSHGLAARGVTHQRMARMVRRDQYNESYTTTTPSSVADGTLTSDEGCQLFYHVAWGDWCIAVANQFEISLEHFYELNTGIDEVCHNLYAGQDYCVKGEISSSSGSSSSSASKTSSSSDSSATAVKNAVNVESDEEEEEDDSDDEECEEYCESRFYSCPSRNPQSSDTTQLADEEEESSSSSTAEATSSEAASSSDASSADTNFVAANAKKEQAQPSTAEAASAATTSSSEEQAASTTAEAKEAASSPSSSSSSEQASSSASSDSGSTNAVTSNVLSSAGISGFLGTNTNAIMSWFRTNSAQDSTNGRSWCGLPYQNDWPGFAPSVGTMLGNFGGDWRSAGKAYCGLEAEFTTPDGTTGLLYIVDGFDDTWVRTPASVDVPINTFAKFFGSYTENKNDVIQNVQWKFTGNRKAEYAFDG